MRCSGSRLPPSRTDDLKHVFINDRKVPIVNAYDEDSWRPYMPGSVDRKDKARGIGMHVVNPNETGYQLPNTHEITDPNLHGETQFTESGRKNACFGRIQRRTPLAAKPEACKAKDCTGALHAKLFPEVMTREMYLKDFRGCGFGCGPKANEGRPN